MGIPLTSLCVRHHHHTCRRLHGNPRILVPRKVLHSSGALELSITPACSPLSTTLLVHTQPQAH